MKKIAFIFPGQGAQYVGMAGDFITKKPDFKAVLAEFDKIHNTNLARIILKGPEQDLKETRYTQPAVLFHSIVALKSFLEEITVKPDFVAGHSLGEFSALVANEVLNFQDALHLVHKRGEFMINANEGKPFGMAAIIGLDPDSVKKICLKASEVDVVIAANFNTPVQTVISGSKAGVDKACEIAKESGAKRTVPLIVGGPFHSPLISKAEKWLVAEMDKINFSDAEIPVIANVNAKPVTNKIKIKQNLAKQVTSSVLWVDSINYMIKNGISVFIEFGPQKVLSGMIKKIDRNVKVLNIDKFGDIESVKAELENIL